MVSFFVEVYLCGIAAGISAAVYHSILRYEYPVNRLSKFFNKHEGKEWTKPLWFCLKCIAGQLGLWSYIFIKWLQQEQNIIVAGFGLVFSICISIFVALAAALILKKTDK